MNLDIKIPKLKKGYKKGSLVINPEAYWRGTLFMMAIVVVFAFVIGYLLFRKVSRDPALSEEETESPALIQEEKLSSVLEYFNARERKSAEIIASPTPVVDPSL